MVVQICHLSYSEGVDRKIVVHASPGQKAGNSILKITEKGKNVWYMAQVLSTFLASARL
jgi:hypothetical protein